MATISASNEKIYQIKKWLGVNECPDGDTDLKNGEAAVMRNFRVTADGALQVRPGTKTLLKLGTVPVRGLWTGYVDGTEVMAAACDGKLWNINTGARTAEEIGDLTTSGRVHMFGYSEKLYIMNGTQYKVWDGDTLSDVAGYRPCVVISAVPTGGGTAYEQINKLNGLRCERFSPTGSAAEFQLAETGLTSVDYVKNLVTGENYTATTDYTVDLTAGTVTFTGNSRTENFEGDGEETAFALSNRNVYIALITIGGTATTDYTYDLSAGTVTFETAPGDGDAIAVTETNIPASDTNTIEIGWTYPEDDRETVLGMRFSELFNGATDNRVFLYGDGTNQTLYSGLDEDGNATAEYFPDLNVMHVGDANTPVTAMIRHYNRLLAFKEDSAYSVYYDTITLSDSTVTAGFFLSTVNKNIGNIALGQAVLVDNHPRTFDGKSIYEWTATSTSGNITGDQRNAKRVSDRVETTLGGLTLSDVYAYNDKYNHEYYAVQGGTAVVNNYGNGTWYIYGDFPAVCMAEMDGELYFGTDAGEIRRVSAEYREDYDGKDSAAIDARWESGNMSFGADFRQKYSAMFWISLKPETASKLSVTLRTDRKSDFLTKTVSRTIATFATANFGAWSFLTNRRPQTSRIKLKAKKFTYYKLIFVSDTANTTATVVSADIRVRYNGNVR